MAASLCPGEAAQVDPTEQLDDLVEDSRKVSSLGTSWYLDVLGCAWYLLFVAT